MIVTTVEVYVKEEHIEDFKKATVENHNASIREAGNLRFDVLQSIDDPARFKLYEVYETEKAAAEHKNTPHYLKWRERVEDWMAKPRKGIAHQVVAPEERERW